MCDTPQHSQLTPPQADEIISHISTLPAEALHALKERLALGMSEVTLAMCAAYYGRAHRDPSVYELTLLDALVRSMARSLVPNMTLTDLQTKDERIAKDVRHWIKINRRPDGKTLPATLSRALGTTAAPIFPLDPRTGARPALLSEEAFATVGTQGLLTGESLAIEGTSLRLSFTYPARHAWPTSPRKGDLVTLLTYPDGADETACDRLQAFLHRHAARLHAAYPLERGTLGARLLGLFPGGLRVDPSLLTAASTPQLSMTLDSAHGCLVCTNEITARALKGAAAEQGLFALTLAQCTNDGHWQIVSGSKALFRLPLPFLRTLARPRHVSVYLEEGETPRTSTLDRRSLICTPDRAGQQRLPAHRVATLDGFKVIHTTLPLVDTLSPSDVVQALMQAATRLVAAGADAEALGVAVGLRVSSTTSPAAIWSAAIGWQRALRLWQLPSPAPVITTSEESADLTLCLYAPGIRPTAPTSKDSSPRIRLFAAGTTQGQPDPRELISMLRLTSRHLASGDIQGLGALWGQAPCEVLSQLDAFSPDAGFAGSATECTPVYGLLVRADRSLALGVDIGTISPESPEKVSDKAATEPLSVGHF